MWTEEQAYSRLIDGMDTGILKEPLMVRRLQPSDLETVQAIDREVLGGYDPAIFSAFCQYHPYTSLVAEVGGRIAGFVLGFKHTPFEGRVFWLAVKPGYQCRGIATRLMLDTFKIFRQMGALSATLEVRVSNKKAQALYYTLGFQMIGIVPAYYSDGEAAIIMRLRL